MIELIRAKARGTAARDAERARLSATLARDDPRSMRVARCGALVCGLLLLAACAPLAPRPPELSDRSPVELVATPFFPQREHECGPAALAMLLGAAGREVAPAALTPLLIVPDRVGSLQPELLAQARRQGFIALPIEPRLEALVAELDAGRPVLVLQNNGLSWYTLWHYAVAVGYDPHDDALILRSGVTERLGIPRRNFEATWARSGRWGFVLLRPGQLPAAGDGGSYATAVAAFESTQGSPAEARRAWSAGVSRWPTRWELAFGLGNRRYADGALAEATAAFEDAVRLAPGRAAPWNNLAVTYMDAGRWDDALQAAGRAAALDRSPDVIATLNEARCRRVPGCR